MSACTIRAATPADAAAIAAITNHYIATTAIHFGYEPVAAAAIAAQLAADRDRFPWFVAVAAAGNAVAGYAKAGTWRAREAYRWTAEVGLYVAPDHHRRGIGRALYAALLPALARAGFHSVVAGVTLPNPASVALHAAFGFAPVGIVRDAGYKHGAWHDVGFYQLVLADQNAAPNDSRADVASTDTARRST